MIDRTKTYAFHSHRIKSGDVFICLPGGESYIQDALEKGATDVLHLNRKQFAEAANDYFEHVTKKCTLIGITGTNGKTSVAYFTKQLLDQLHCSALMIGTLNSSLTTPESWDTLERIKDHVDSGGSHVVMEVSSHGIDQCRVWGMDFDIKCLTNITQDHLDYHGSVEAYRAAKMTFMESYSGLSIFPDDVILLDYNDIPNLKGECHRKNVSMAVAICCKLGLPLIDILPILPNIQPPQGRFEGIQMNQPYQVIVDFAHTPDALENVLNSINKIRTGNEMLITVIGCGGGRDVDKRPKMGRIATQMSDKVIFTSDNPRAEDPQLIIDQMEQGVGPEDFKKFLSIPDRKQAIKAACQMAHPNDIILVAGKGHETYQEIQGVKIDFDDLKELKSNLKISD